MSNLRRRQALQGQANLSTPFDENNNSEQASVPKPDKYILVLCRQTTKQEKNILSKNFHNIVNYDAELVQGKLDLSTISFDLLLVDANVDANRKFLEVISPQANELGIPIVVLKKSLTNSKELATALNASVISSIRDYDNNNLPFYMTKFKLPKLTSRIMFLFKQCYSFVSKQ